MYYQCILLVLLLKALPAGAQASDRDIVAGLNRTWIASYEKKDTAAIERILAADFVMVNPAGKKIFREDVIKNVGSKDQDNIAIIDSAEVRIFGNTALVVAYLHFTLTSNGKTSNGTNCYSDLYVKRKGIWQAVAAHVTLLSMQ